MSDVDVIRSAGWTQGSTFTASADEENSALTVGASYMVVSHPCDVVSMSLERDPAVEVTPVTLLDAVDGNYTFGKNPRVLHLDRESGPIELRRGQNLVIDRRLLSAIAPTAGLGEFERRLLASWLAARYARPAFADEFNRRMEPVRRAMEKILKSSGRHMSGIYVATALEELAPEADYKVIVAVTMLADSHADAAAFAEVNEACDRIRDAIERLDGIQLVELDVTSERDLTLEDLRTLARWDYDSLSFRDGDEGVQSVNE